MPYIPQTDRTPHHRQRAGMSPATIADILNREYQAGGDTKTLVAVARAFATAMNASDIDGFYEIASMGGLPLAEWPTS